MSWWEIILIVMAVVVLLSIIWWLWRNGSFKFIGLQKIIYRRTMYHGSSGRAWSRLKKWIWGAAALIALGGRFIWEKIRYYLGKFRRKKHRPQEKEELDNLKKPEDRAFWIEDEQKEQASTAHIIAKTYFEQAEEMFAKKDWRRAERLFLEAARENPHDAKIFNRLGVIYLEYKKFHEAIEAFEAALKYDDKIGSRHFNLALAYLGQGSFEQAKASLMRAVSLSPNNEKYHEVLEEVKKKC